MNRPDDSPKNSILIYTTEDGLTKIDTTFDGDTVWLSIDQMAELFQRDKSTISRHIKNIFAEGELERDSVVAKFATTAADGKTYQVEFYNLDVIISVGYRVKSKRGTQFRIWATGILKEYMRKGFALDDERLKNLGGGGYFKEKELRAMGQLVSGYLDFAERQAEREQPMTMQDWANHLDRILTMSGEQLLIGNGSVTHKQAVDKATTEYRKYKAKTLSNVEQDYLDSIKFLEQKTGKK